MHETSQKTYIAINYFAFASKFYNKYIHQHALHIKPLVTYSKCLQYDFVVMPVCLNTSQLDEFQQNILVLDQKHVTPLKNKYKFLCLYF